MSHDNYHIEYKLPENAPVKQIKIDDPFSKRVIRKDDNDYDHFLVQFLPPDSTFEDHPFIIYPYHAIEGVFGKGLYFDDDSARALAEAILNELDSRNNG